MRATHYLTALLGCLLLLPSLIGSMYVSAFHIHVDTWTPFVIGGFLGYFILNNALDSKNGAVGVIGMLAGGSVFLGAVMTAMIVSASPELTVSTWKPFIWSGIAGFWIMCNARVCLATSSPKRKSDSDASVSSSSSSNSKLNADSDSNSSSNSNSNPKDDSNSF